MRFALFATLLLSACTATAPVPGAPSKVYGRSLNVDPDQIAIWSSAAYIGGENYGHYHNPQVDQQLAQARTVPGCAQADRKALYDTFQLQVADDQPVTFLYTRNTLTAVNKRLHGISPSPSVRTAWNIKEWTIN